MAVDDRIARLRAAPARWWAGEAEVVRTYFSQPRTAADAARWPQLQAAREVGAAAGQANEAPVMFEAVEATVERHDLEAAVRVVYEEVRHYRLLADILEEATGSDT